MKFLILGSSGTIGNALTQYLQEKGHITIQFDIEAASYQDLRIDYAVDSYINEADFVFFLAFDVGGSQYLKKYQSTFDFVDNNVRIMTNTFRALKEANKPFLFASTQMSNMNFSNYGALKSVGEHYCRTLNSPIIKFWNIYGIEFNQQKTHVITDFVKLAVKGNPIIMRTNGLEERQFLYASDCCEALYNMSLGYDKLSRISEYHVTSFEWVNIIRVASIISELCGGATIIPSVEHDTVQRDQRNEPNPFIINDGLWKPKMNLKNGIARIVEYEKLHATN